MRLGLVRCAHCACVQGRLVTAGALGGIGGLGEPVRQTGVCFSGSERLMDSHLLKGRSWHQLQCPRGNTSEQPIL